MAGHVQVPKLVLFVLWTGSFAFLLSENCLNLVVEFRKICIFFPTTVFCKMSVRRSKYCPQFSITWGRLIISTWSFHSCTVFEANSNKFPTIFWSLNFIHFTPQFRLFFLEKKKPKPFSGHKNVMGRGIRKILIFVIKCLKCLKHFRENNIEFLEISKRLEFPLGRPNGYKF